MAEALKEIAETLKDALVTPVQEAFVYRARNPFFGTLVISWLFYNWNKVAYFFLSDDKVIERINFIKHKIPDNSVIFDINIPHTHSIIFPFAWAVFLSFTFPFFTYASIWIHKWITGHIETINSGKEIARIRLQKDLMVEMAINESAKAKQLAIDEAEIELSKEASATHRANIEAIKVRKKSLEDEIATLEERLNTLKSSFNLTSNDYDNKSRELEKVTSDYEDAVKKYNSLADLKSERDLFKKDLAEAETTIKSLNDQVEILRVDANKFDDMDNSIRNRDKTIDSLNQKVKDISLESHKLNVEKHNVIKAINELVTRYPRFFRFNNNEFEITPEANSVFTRLESPHAAILGEDKIP